jgi:hypothetical protein
MHCARCGTPLQDDWDRCLFCEGLDQTRRTVGGRGPLRSPDLHHRAPFWVALCAVLVTIAGAAVVTLAPDAWVLTRPSLTALEVGDQDPHFRLHVVETVEHYCRHRQNGEEADARVLVDSQPSGPWPDDDAVRVRAWTVEEVAADREDARVRVLQRVYSSEAKPRTRTAVFRLRPVDGVWRIYDMRVSE